MFKSLSKIWKKERKDVVINVAKLELRKNREVVESLRDYDTGTKEISTRDVERRLGNIQVAPQE